MNRIAVITDTWHPQINGVVTTVDRTAGLLREQGHEVEVIAPDRFRSIPCPMYPEIRVALWPFKGMTRLLDEFRPDAVNICTEGPIGFAGRRYCVKRGLRFTTSFHTQLPEYIHMRVRFPLAWSYAYVRWFHNGAVHTMVNTEKVRQNLEEHGLQRFVTWTRGVDTEVFKPAKKNGTLDVKRPIYMYVGRVALEKNLTDFLDLDLPGTKYVIGGGPSLKHFRARYPEAVFAGYIRPPTLAEYVADADVFVFPSKTDTFGVVMLEAMACGVPVAAYPVQGPIDVVKQGETGVLDDDLGTAIKRALELDPEDCRRYACQFSWDNCAEQFRQNLVPARSN